MNAHDLKARVLPALLVGTSRQPPDYARLFGGAIHRDDPKAALKALALTGQALRFERPAPPTEYAADPIHNAKRASIAEALRPVLVRLFGDGKGSISPHDDLALGLALTFERLRLSPHPFDFPRMDGFVRVHAERLGPDACAWADRDKSAQEKRGYFDIDLLDDGNWAEAAPVRRMRFIRDRRREDADAARSLVESVWNAESAELRFRLLQALRTGLAIADKPFLEGLAKDRAPRVRELAARYLSRLPGEGGENPALKSVLQRITRGQSGFLRKRAVLKLELPATVNAHAVPEWIKEAFSGVEFDELARALALSEIEMIGAGEKDAHLPVAFALMATRDGRLDLLPAIAAILASPWHILLSGSFDELSRLDQGERQVWAETLFPPARAEALDLTHALHHLLRLLEGPVPERMLDGLLRSPAWQEAMQGRFGYSFLEPVAALCPPAMRPALRFALARLEPAQTVQIQQFLDILDRIEKVTRP